MKCTKRGSLHYGPYLIATAIANMGANDYLAPEKYFKTKIKSIKENQFDLSSLPISMGYSSDFNSNMYYVLDKEKPNEEAHFKYTLYLQNEKEVFSFQTIRFFVIDDVAFIGAIQGSGQPQKSIFEKKIKRILYKANEGITPENELYNTNPGAVITLTSLISILNSQEITHFTTLPYGLQRWNDKKILYHNLSEKLINNKVDEKNRFKVKQIIEKTSSYFDKAKVVRSQLNNALLRFAYHFNQTQAVLNDQAPTVVCEKAESGNNNILNNVYSTFQDFENKKTNR